MTSSTEKNKGKKIRTRRTSILGRYHYFMWDNLEDLSEGLTFEQRPKRTEKESHWGTWSRSKGLKAVVIAST